MTIRSVIQQDMTAAMKARDQERLDALRYLLSQIKNKEIDAKHELTDEEATKLLTTEAKRRRESIDAYQKGGRADLVEKERYELSVIEEFLPKQLTDDELRAMIEEVKKENPDADFGTLMRTIMTKVAGKGDGSRIAKMLQGAYPR